MTNGWIGYHPERLDTLRRRVGATVDDLRSLRSDDPVAAAALQQVDRALLHLETDWLALIDQMRASPAMVAPISGRAPGSPGRAATDGGSSASRRSRPSAPATW